MASRRKGWSELSPSYRARLERNGVTESQYTSGASIRSARGHAVTPERLTGYRRIANEMGISFIAPEYDEYAEALTAEEQSEIARDFVRGFMTRGRSTKAGVIARMDFLQWLREIRGGELSREDWRTYRALYLAHFGSRKA